MAGDKPFVADGLCDIDYGTGGLSRKAKAPIRPGDPISQFSIALKIANTARTDQARGTICAQHEQEGGINLAMLVRGKTDSFVWGVGPWCAREVADDTFIGNRLMQLICIFGPAWPQQ